MANKKRQNTPNSSLIGHQTQPTLLDTTTKLDIDTSKSLLDNVIEASIAGGLNVGELEKFTSISMSRDQVYNLIETMIQDSTVSAIVRTYTEDVCEPADNGHIVWCESSDPNISKFVNYLLNVMNVDKNIYRWVYSLIEYGDTYLRLFRESDYEDDFFKKDSINRASYRNVLNEDYKKDLDENVNISLHSINDHYSYYIEMVPNPGSMFELTKLGKTYGYIEVPSATINGLNYTDNYAITNNQTIANYAIHSGDVNVYQADDFVHACLDDNFTRFPEQVELVNDTKAEDNLAEHTNSIYGVRRGKSLLIDSYKIWREKSLLEDSALLNRVTRSSLVRTIQIEVGDMSKEQVQQTLRRIKDLFEQKVAINTGKTMNEYTNAGPLENNVYLATHNGKGALSVGQVGGDVDVRGLADLDWWNNKFYSSYGIPKQYMGWTDDGAGFNGGTSLTILSSIYAKGVKRVQNAMLQALTDAINLIFIDRGYKSYLNNFVLKMRAPVTQEELDYRSSLTNKLSALSNFQSLLSDIEDKARRLEILKVLVGTLEYDDNIIQEIQKEIDATIAANKKAAEEAANTENGETSNTETPEETDDLPAMENFNTNKQEKEILVEDSLFLEAEEDLPSPEDLNKDKDFSKNE